LIPNKLKIRSKRKFLSKIWICLFFLLQAPTFSGVTDGGQGRAPPPLASWL